MKKIMLGVVLLFLITSCGQESETQQVVEETSETPVETVQENQDSELVAQPEESVDAEESENQDADSEANMLSGNVEIMLSDKLDGILSEYCLDIAGGNQDVDPDNGLQAHTCYSYKGNLGTDQVFDAGAFKSNSLSMPIYNVCVFLPSLESGASVELSDCDTATAISFSGTGTIRPVDAPDLCFTASQDSRMGKWSQHQIRDLTLETCDESKAVYQNWESRWEVKFM